MQIDWTTVVRYRPNVPFLKIFFLAFPWRTVHWRYYWSLFKTMQNQDSSVKYLPLTAAESCVSLDSKTATTKSSSCFNRYLIYNPETGKIFTRTPKSWLLITVFYLIYYSCLAGFWAAMLNIFFLTLEDHQPKWVLFFCRINSIFLKYRLIIFRSVLAISKNLNGNSAWQYVLFV